jgi:hypothetical protein
VDVLKDYKAPLIYRGQTLYLAFDLNVMEKIQEEYGSVEAWGKLTSPDPEDVLDNSGKVIGSNAKEPDLKALIFGFTEMINEGIEIANDEDGGHRPLFTSRQVGRIITEVGLDLANAAMKKAVTDSTDTGADTKNG